MNGERFLQLHMTMAKLISEYGEIYNQVWGENDFKNPFRDIISKTLPDLLRQCAGLSEQYYVYGSYGKGKWTEVPWIAICDTRITKTAQKGVYIVYLLNKDAKELYLTLEIAATETVQTDKTEKSSTNIARPSVKISESAIKLLQNKAAHVRKIIKNDYFSSDHAMNVSASQYKAGAVYYKKYSLNTLPSGAGIVEDLQAMLKLYQAYYEKFVLHAPIHDNAPPEKVEEKTVNELHQLGMFDSWEIIDEHTAKKHCDKSFFEHRGSGVPRNICWFFGIENPQQAGNHPVKLIYKGKEYQGRLTIESNELRRLRIFWSTGLGQAIEEYRDQEGVCAVYTKQAENTFILTMESAEKVGEEAVPMSTREALSQISAYIASRGFSYPAGLIENFFLSLKAKPFVILAGTSGTGKTRLVRLFAEAIGAEYRLVSVRPDWSDGSDLFGHNDLNGNFVKGPAAEAFELALQSPSKPVFLCLDEMNLARVEYYLSDFLSVIESREKKDGQIITSPFDYDCEAYKKGIPDNLYIVGTVNMDETTFPFSKKVLDRANTIEFSYVNLMPDFESAEVSAQALQLPNSFLRTEYLVLAKDCAGEQTYVNEICGELQAINQILLKANAHVGYRVRDEIVFYLLNNKAEGSLLPPSEAMDNEIMQKILPRIQGSSAAVRDMLRELFTLCAGDPAQKTGDTEAEKMRRVLDDPAITCRYRKSAEKLELMVRRFEEDGFTSYWL